MREVCLDVFIDETWELAGSCLGEEEDVFGCFGGDAGFIVNVTEEGDRYDSQDNWDEIPHLLRISIKVNNILMGCYNIKSL